MKIAIHQPHYLPWLGYFAKWAAADVFVLLDTVQYEKHGWQNRNRVKTAQGPRWLTVPVRAHLGTPLREVRIDARQPWRRRHLGTLEQAYAAAPHLERYRKDLHALYETPWARLVDAAAASAAWLGGALGVRTPLVRASELAVRADDPTERLVDVCRAVGGTTYLAGRDGARYMDLARFRAAGIAVHQQEYAHPGYAQLHGAFVPFLSAVDLLLLHGDQALEILRSGDRWTVVQD